jgi:large subunit ribosomal protein L18
MTKDNIVKSKEERPRFVVSRSIQNVFAQIIDDKKGHTLIGISSKTLKKGRANTDVAKLLGEKIGEEAVKIGIKKVVFDRSGKPYHGRIKAVADGARSKGLEF